MSQAPPGPNRPGGPPERRPSVNPKLMAGRKGFKRIETIERRERPQFLVLLLLILGIALVVFKLTAGRSATEENVAAPVDDPQWERSAPARLDPETFRPQIQRLERFLYDPNSANDLSQIGQNIDNAAVALDRALHEHGASGEAAAQAVGALVETVDPTRFGLADLESVRSRWKQLRRQHFQDAPWLATGTPSRDDQDRATLLVLRDFANRLANLSADGESEVAALQQEAEVAINDEAAAAVYAQWAPWAEGWQARIAALQAEKPSFYAPQAAPELLLAVQGLDRALATLQNLANDRNLPQQPDAVNRIAGATAQAENARRAFDAELF